MKTLIVLAWLIMVSACSAASIELEAAPVTANMITGNLSAGQIVLADGTHSVTSSSVLSEAAGTLTATMIAGTTFNVVLDDNAFFSTASSTINGGGFTYDPLTGWAQLQSVTGENGVMFVIRLTGLVGIGPFEGIRVGVDKAGGILGRPGFTWGFEGHDGVEHFRLTDPYGNEAINIPSNFSSPGVTSNVSVASLNVTATAIRVNSPANTDYSLSVDNASSSGLFMQPGGPLQFNLRPGGIFGVTSTGGHGTSFTVSDAGAGEVQAYRPLKYSLNTSGSLIGGGSPKTLTWSQTLSSTTYQVIFTSTDATNGLPTNLRVTTKNTTSCILQYTSAVTTTFDATVIVGP